MERGREVRRKHSNFRTSGVSAPMSSSPTITPRMKRKSVVFHTFSRRVRWYPPVDRGGGC